MFKLKQTKTFTWPVEVNVIVGDGAYEKCSFNGVFRRVGVAEFEGLHKQLEDGTITGEDFVRQVMEGWDGVTDGDEPVPFTPEALASLLDQPAVASAIVMAYGRAHAGLLRKN